MKLDSQKFQDAINHMTHGLGGAKAASACGDLEDKLNGKLDDWMTNTVKNGAGIAANFDAQSAKTLILKYQVAIDNPALLHQSWNYFCVGNIQLALGAGGLKLEPGSGVSTDINRSLTIGVTFFNFFHAQDVNSYFQQTKVYITDTGNVRFLFDVGEESDTTVNKALQKARVHFVADAQATTGADVKLQIELSETNNKDEARHMAAIPELPAAEVRRRVRRRTTCSSLRPRLPRAQSISTSRWSRRRMASWPARPTTATSRRRINRPTPPTGRCFTMRRWRC